MKWGWGRERGVGEGLEEGREGMRGEGRRGRGEGRRGSGERVGEVGKEEGLVREGGEGALTKERGERMEEVG